MGGGRAGAWGVVGDAKWKEAETGIRRAGEGKRELTEVGGERVSEVTR